MSHTPGPWMAEEQSTGERAYQIVGGGRTVVAHAYGTAEWSGSPSVTPEQNARLIASAPDLLASVKALLNCIGSMEEKGHDVKGCVYCEAKALILKAEGGGE